MTAPMRLACTLVAFAWAWSPTLAAEDAVVEQWSLLKAEYAGATKAWVTAYDAQKDDGESIARYREWPGFAFAPRFVAFGESAQGHEAGFEALGEVVRMARSIDPIDVGLQPHLDRALDLILQHHRDRELTPFQFAQASPGFERFWRTLSVEGESKELRARATFCLGYALKTKSDTIRSIAQSAYRPSSPLSEYITSRRQENWNRYVGSTTAEDAAAEAVKVFETVVADYPDVKSVSRPDTTLAERAEVVMYEIKCLSVGRTAPDIAGKDLAGEPIKLSDFRGKVIVLVFWASWCGPCMEAVPHEKELAQRFANRPFTVVGINLDRTQEFANEAVEKHQIPWRSFWDGGEEFGPIATAWNARALPMMYVIDHTGVIRFTHLSLAALDAPLDLLIKEAENG